MLKETSEKLEGNDQFEGFGIDVIDELSKKLGFSYTFRLQPDNKYGGIDPKTGEWNGMLREIMDNVSFDKSAFINLIGSGLSFVPGGFIDLH